MIVASINTLFTLYAKDMHLYQNFIGRDASNLAKLYTVMDPVWVAGGASLQSSPRRSPGGVH